MFDLLIRFKSPLNLLIFLLLTVICCLWIYRGLKKNFGLNLTPFILVNVLIFLAWGSLVGISHDEAENLHCAWMVSQGMIPFRDFWQHHSPLLWIVLAPFFRILKPSVLIFQISRIFSTLIFILIAFSGWQIAKRVWQEKAKKDTYLLMLFSASVLGEFLWIRSDMYMSLFLLFSLYFSLEIPGRRLLPAFLAGVTFTLAASFTFKQYFLFFLPLIVIFSEKNKLNVSKLLIYFLGLAVGSLPLLSYLIKENILREFIFWVFKFNQNNLMTSVVLPIAIGFMGIWGAFQSLSRYRKFKNTKALILFLAFCLSTLSSITGTFGRYYLGFWFILCAVVISGYNIIDISEKIPSLIKKSLMLGFFCSLLIFQNFMHAKTQLEATLSENKKVISKLLEYCRNDTCMVILPLHPIFSYDATRLYSYWQYDFVFNFSSIRDDIGIKDMPERIINLRPAVIMYSFKNKIFFLELFQKRLISGIDFKKLVNFLAADYTIKRIGEENYYIRNDKL